MEKSLVFDMPNGMADAGVKDGGVPRINRITDAVRKISELYPNEVENEDLTEEVSEQRLTNFSLHYEKKLMYWNILLLSRATYHRAPRYGDVRT